MSRYATMPPRLQQTPFGEVTLTSRWLADRYILRASGPQPALRWMFPRADAFELREKSARHSFEPHPGGKVTVERQLREVCQQWQDGWCEKLQTHLEDGGTTQPQSAKPSTLVALIAERAVGRQVSAKTAEKDRHYMALWVKALGETPLTSVSADQLIAAREKLATKLKPSTINCAFATLKSHLDYAFKKGYIPVAPHAGIPKLKEPKGHTRKAWWTAADVSIALHVAAADSHRAAAELLIGLGCLAGLRYEEVIMLRWCDVDLDGVDAATGAPEPVLNVVAHSGWKPKNGDGRTIPINTKLAAILRRHRRAEGYLLMPEPVANRVKPARPRKADAKRSYRYDPKKVWNRVVVAVVKAGGRMITPHGMRHSFASNLLISKVSEFEVARWLGHADTTLIHERYGHLLAYRSTINAVVYPDVQPRQIAMAAGA